MQTNYKIPKRKQPIWKIFSAIVSPFLKAKTIINLNSEPLPEKCILVSNHANKKGPLTLELSLPLFHTRWAAYQMLGNYKDRFLYLRDVLYIKKNKSKKFPATIKALFEAIFAPMIYKGIKAIPSYPGARMRTTIEYSIKCLDENIAVSVYPENSNTGYHDQLVELYAGFVMMSELYYKHSNLDIPIYPVYIGKIKGKKALIIGKPMKVGKLKEQGLDRKEIAEKFRLAINNLYFEYIRPKK
ncbi:MAG: hypothetical protein E7348_02045 [Clostridiales bacterium]|nr:hypothetical protein [Clostridiales bacterium]